MVDKKKSEAQKLMEDVQRADNALNILLVFVICIAVACGMSEVVKWFVEVMK